MRKTRRWSTFCTWAVVAAVAAAAACEEEGAPGVTDVAVATVEAEELGEDFEDSLAVMTLAGATAQALESDQAMTLLGELTGTGKMGDCAEIGLDGTTLNIDYTPCDHADGHVVIDRLEAATWLLSFQEDFEVWGVGMVGNLLLERVDRGEFDVFTAAADGTGAGTTPIVLTWEGRTATLEREVLLTGDLLTSGTMVDRFALAGEGDVRREASAGVLDMGLGGALGEAKDHPLEYPRPTTGRCPSAGEFHLQGPLAARLAARLQFTVGERVYDLSVNLGSLAIDADVGFTLVGGAIDAVGIVTTGPVIVPDAAVLDALAASSLAESVKAAIRQAVADHLVPEVPLGQVQSAVSAAVSTLIADTAVCP
jgi:hypothetical protein